MRQKLLQQAVIFVGLFIGFILSAIFPLFG
jgi:hypothetical protein